MDYSLILSSELSKQAESLNSKQRLAVQKAIILCTISAVEAYRSNEAKAINKEAVTFFGSIIKGEWIAWVRYQYLKRAKKTAQITADTRNMLVYVIRKSAITYSIIPNDMIDHHKRKGTFKKNITAKELNDLADFIAYPERISSRPILVKHQKK